MEEIKNPEFCEDCIYEKHYWGKNGHCPYLKECGDTPKSEKPKYYSHTTVPGYNPISSCYNGTMIPCCGCGGVAVLFKRVVDKNSYYCAQCCKCNLRVDCKDITDIDTAIMIWNKENCTLPQKEECIKPTELININEDNSAKKPPIGIMPRDLWTEHVKAERQQDLKETIIRYAQEGIVIPTEWVSEYNLLTNSLRLDGRCNCSHIKKYGYLKLRRARDGKR